MPYSDISETAVCAKIYPFIHPLPVTSITSLSSTSTSISQLFLHTSQLIFFFSIKEFLSRQTICRFEPPTFWSVAKRSIQLSYAHTTVYFSTAKIIIFHFPHSVNRKIIFSTDFSQTGWLAHFIRIWTFYPIHLHAKIITSCSISEEKAIVPATQYINFTYQNLKRSRYDKKNRSDQ